LAAIIRIRNERCDLNDGQPVLQVHDAFSLGRPKPVNFHGQEALRSFFNGGNQAGSCYYMVHTVWRQARDGWSSKP
jgi:hypothetical protein